MHESLMNVMIKMHPIPVSLLFNLYDAGKQHTSVNDVNKSVNELPVVIQKVLGVS